MMSVRNILLATACSAFLAASAAVSGATATTPENALVSKAYQALQAGAIETAVTDYTKAIESRSLEPEVLANALLNRGLAYQRLNEHEFAIDDYTAALRIDAMSGKLRALALYNRGLSYQRLDRDSLAMEDYTSALFLDGQFSHAYYSRGTLLRDSGQYLFALADFDKALRYQYPDPARVYVAESMAFEKLQRTDDARDALTKALAANPSYEPAKRRLAALNGANLVASAASGDQLQTATIAPAGTALPEAAAPSAALLGEDGAGQSAASSGGKLYTDRVPPQPQKQLASAELQPAQEPAAEKVLAVETVPEDAPAAEAASAPAPAAEVASAAAPAAEATAADAQEATQADAPKITGWAIQLASATSEDGAWALWKKMQASKKVLKGKEAVVVRADLGTKGIFYRLRLVGYDSQGDASRACGKLKSGGVKCYVSKAAS
jgi:Tfp pilus assembly protein PilF